LSHTVTRTGLVLGAGGILGSAWMTGALAALAERLERPLAELDLVLGTSAGSVLAAALRCGLSVAELVDHHLDRAPPGERPEDGFPAVRTIEHETGDGLPPIPLPVVGSPRLLAAAVAPPFRVPPLVALAGLLPLGRARVRSLVRLVENLQARLGATPDRWVPGAPLWVVALDYDTGRRVVFGRPGGPPSSVADAVLASCAIPGWIAPQVIDARRYVDGALASTTSVGLLAEDSAPPLDELYVLAPMASHAYDHPLDPVAGLERGFRRCWTLALDREVEAVRATGIRVTVLTPGRADLVAMGGNLMDPYRRRVVLETSMETSQRALAAVSAAA
jgi:NTE family protein